jgi:hypothetical protein
VLKYIARWKSVHCNMSLYGRGSNDRHFNSYDIFLSFFCMTDKSVYHVLWRLNVLNRTNEKMMTYVLVNGISNIN